MTTQYKITTKSKMPVRNSDIIKIELCVGSTAAEGFRTIS